MARTIVVGVVMIVLGALVIIFALYFVDGRIGLVLDQTWLK